ncbi:DUF3810 domain-containing protein [Oribacterium sp. P6A1]|uniref:DUF3810 domain-containing protein n=1 Tax=Oribacterium sp. P6A1 TaxID=1410612 RepID=UPI00068F6866|nr:DUF3810 domain-containing protein [Oribacterium sp. P6A1]
MLIFDLMALAASAVASESSVFANAYSHSVYRSVSLFISSITGLLPFSLVEILFYVLLIFIPGDLVFQIASSFRKHSSKRIESPDDETGVTGPQQSALPVSPKSPRTGPSKSQRLAGAASAFLLHLFLIFSLLFTLYVFNCGINYRRSSFSSEAGLSSVSPELNEKALTELCEYLVENINASELKLLSPYTEATSSSDWEALYTSPVKLENGAFLGESWSSEKPSLSYLRNTGKTGQAAMEKIGTQFPRLSGHYPLPKPLINSWILSIQQVTGVYSPFTIEANYNRDIPYYDIPFTVCHELSHLRGYMQEEEANFIAILATIGSDDTYFNYSGYVSAWVYAGNALATANPEKFAELYNRINIHTRQDMRYNNEFWDQYETEVAEAHEKINDAYLKYNGQASGVLSYGHVVDLMVVYYNDNGTLHY